MAKVVKKYRDYVPILKWCRMQPFVPLNVIRCWARNWSYWPVNVSYARPRRSWPSWVKATGLPSYRNHMNRLAAKAEPRMSIYWDYARPIGISWRCRSLDHSGATLSRSYRRPQLWQSVWNPVSQWTEHSADLTVVLLLPLDQQGHPEQPKRRYPIPCSYCNASFAVPCWKQRRNSQP